VDADLLTGAADGEHEKELWAIPLENLGIRGIEP
jgi:hypothetical protein